MRHGAASRLARATHDWRRAREPRYNIAASRLARATHDWRRARGPRYNIAASRLARATHGVDRPRGPRYNRRRVPERAVLPRGLAPDLAGVRVADGRGERRRVDRRGRGARGRRADRSEERRVGKEGVWWGLLTLYEQT